MHRLILLKIVRWGLPWSGRILLKIYIVDALFVAMNDSPELHEEILDWARKEFSEILGSSEQAIYIYVCDKHKLCNENFSSMLGYDSPEEWAKKEEMIGDVKDDDQEVLVSAYKDAMENKIGSSIDISWKDKKSGSLIDTNVILVPLSYKGELFALHFITKI